MKWSNAPTRREQDRVPLCTAGGTCPSGGETRRPGAFWGIA